MTILRRIVRWFTGYDAKMRVLALLSRDEARLWPIRSRAGIFTALEYEGEGLVFVIDEDAIAGESMWKLTDAGVAAVEEWRAGR